MKFGFAFGMLGKGGAGGTNATIDPIGTDGSKYGFLAHQFGTITPDHTTTGDLFHEVTWDPTTGAFIVSFGPAGHTQLAGVSQIHVKGAGGSDLVLVWNSTANAYTGTDIPLAQALPTTGKVDFGIYFLPDMFIHYDFKEILKGTKI